MFKFKKKLIILFIVLSMVISIVGCANNSTEENNSNNNEVSDNNNEIANSENTENETENQDEDAYEVVMPFIHTGNIPTDLELVQETLSEYTKEKINVTVKFKPANISELTNQYNLWVSSGEKVDLLHMFMMNLGKYVNDGTAIQLDDLLDYAPTIVEKSEKSPFLSGGYYNNKLYAIPVINPATGEGKAMYARTDLLEEINYEEKNLHSYEDIDNIFSSIKENHPEMIMWATAGSLNSTNSYFFINYDNLGIATASSGVIMDVGTDNTEIVNLFKTDEYKEYLTWMRKWYKEGYISKDAATTSDNPVDWVKAGRCAGFSVGDDTIGNEANQEALTGYAMTQLNIKETYVTTNTYNQLRWIITSNSENPQKTMEFLDLWYSDAYVLDLIQNGIEGVHWEKTENEKIIDYPEGINGTNTPYSNPLGIYGDKRIMSMFVPNGPEFYEISKQYTKDAVTKPSVALGYSFNLDEYTTEVAAISSVMSEYLSALEYGMVEIDSTLDEFNDDLEDAGIEVLIEANREQFNNWLDKQ